MADLQAAKVKKARRTASRSLAGKAAKARNVKTISRGKVVHATRTKVK